MAVQSGEHICEIRSTVLVVSILRGMSLGQEAGFRTLAPTAAPVHFLRPGAVLGILARPTLPSADIHGPGVRLGHVCSPIQVRPQAAFETHCLNEVDWKALDRSSTPDIPPPDLSLAFGQKPVMQLPQRIV